MLFSQQLTVNMEQDKGEITVLFWANKLFMCIISIGTPEETHRNVIAEQ